MYAAITSYTLRGIQGIRIQVEVDLTPGLSNFHLVGLPSTAVRESKDRVRAAIQNSGFTFPLGRITVNLAPADLRKEGPSLDLPICIGILAASRQLSAELCKNSAFLGEIALDGTLLPVRGQSSLAHSACEDSILNLFVPASQAAHARYFPDMRISPVRNLKHCVDVLQGLSAPCLEIPGTCIPPEASGLEASSEIDGVAWDSIQGQWQAKRALVVAAAGGHNLLIAGPPGAGKTLLCRALPRLLPPLCDSEAKELQLIYSALPAYLSKNTFDGERPFRSPHHSISPSGLLGGGNYPRPGEITLAHHGILFLDELLEFPKSLLDQLREPVERRSIVIARAAGHFTFPANFQLVAACNPCPCGFYGTTGFTSCSCTPHTRSTYQNRASGPLLDRFDLRIYLPPLHSNTLQSESEDPERMVLAGAAVCSEHAAKEAVAKAWLSQQNRNGTDKNGALIKNTRLSGTRLSICELTSEAEAFLTRLIKANLLTGRGRDAVIRVAQTLADLAVSPQIDLPHIAEAYQLRSNVFA